MKRQIILTVLGLLSGLYAEAQSYKIIVNSSNTTTSLSSRQVSDFFLKKKTKWDSGQRVIPVDLSGSSSIRKEFSSQILKKSIVSIRSYWQQYVFAGKGTPPVEKKLDSEVISFVKRNSGAIGYVSKRARLFGVKEVKIID